MAQQNIQRRKSFIVFGIIFLLAALAGIATLTFFAKMQNTVRVFYVKNTDGIQAYQQVKAADIGDTYVQADTLKLYGGEKYDNVFVYDAEAKNEQGQADGGLSKMVGKYAIVPMAYGETVMTFKLEDAKGGSYKSGLYEKPGTKLLTFQVPLVNAVAGQLVPGDFMDVLYSDKESGRTTKILTGIEVVDIKYGSNPFSAEAAASTDANATGEEKAPEAPTGSDPLKNTVNPAVGDQALIIINLPGAMVDTVAPFLMDSGNLYIVAATPPGLNAAKPASEASGTVEPTAEASSTK